MPLRLWHQAEAVLAGEAAEVQGACAVVVSDRRVPLPARAHP